MLIVLIVLFSFTSDHFFSQSNMITILRQIANTGVLSIGMAFVLIAGGIDLSIGSQAGLNGMITALLMTAAGCPIWLSCLIGIAMNAAIGAAIGTLITITNMPPLIATLGLSYLCTGCAYLSSGGFPVYGLPEGVKVFGQGYIGSVFPVCVLILIIIVALGAFVLNKTHLGRQFYAVGSNPEAARLSGIQVRKIKILSYTISGTLAGIAGLILMSRTNSGQPLNGQGAEMDALIACVVGGISVAGGEGKAVGIIGGILVMGVLANGMAVMGLSEYTQELVKGLVLIVVVAVDAFSKTHTFKKKKIAA